MKNKIKMKKLKIGDTCEVVEVLNSFFPSIYKKGNVGAIEYECPSGSVTAFVKTRGYGKRYIRHGIFKKVGRLTVTKLK